MTAPDRKRLAGCICGGVAVVAVIIAVQLPWAWRDVAVVTAGVGALLAGVFFGMMDDMRRK